jgi:hypothetical protein
MYKFSDICGGRYFVIPENQRGFSWGPSQVTDVINDLNLAGTQSHYMGPLIVSRSSTPDFQDDELTTTVEFILEDGQQRLTTLVIFANEIRKRLEAKGIYAVHAAQLENLIFLKHNGRQLRIQNKQPTLHDYLSYTLIGTPAPPAERVPAMRALDEVRARISGYLDALSDNELLAWKQKLSNQALFVWVDLATAGVNRYLTFDAINSRGLALSEFDKIKNFCILICSIRTSITHLTVSENWYKALVQLQSFGVDSRSNEADYIAELFSSYHGKSISHREVHSAFVSKYESLLTAPNPALEAHLTHFVSLWESYAKSFGLLTCRSRQKYYQVLCTTEAGKWLDRLDNMDLPTITRPLLVASHMNFPASDFAEVARACEIYTFRVHAVIRKRKDANAVKIVELANQVLIGGKGLTDVFQAVCKWLKAYAPMASIIQELVDGKAKYAFDQSVVGLGHCYYFLYEYELSVSPSGVAPLPYSSNKDVVKNQQEHILPQAHRDGAWWESAWPDASRADRYKHRLGNLTLTVDNIALGRKPIAQKLNEVAPIHCYTHANATNSEKRIPLFTDGTNWQVENILNREVELMRFAAKRWGLGCAEDNVQLSLPPEFSQIGITSISVDSGINALTETPEGDVENVVALEGDDENDQI